MASPSNQEPEINAKELRRRRIQQKTTGIDYKQIDVTRRERKQLGAMGREAELLQKDKEPRRASVTRLEKRK